ncbi:MAG: SigE family RNA polymerase sigma factor [Actinobacteria bacterium]|nr:SigE family RNA polymerase sigma factor [Actinomycetota bacterium]
MGANPAAEPIERSMMAELGFDAFVRERSAGLLRFAHLLSGNPDDAAELVQEALTNLYPRWERVAGAGDPEPYVKRSIVNSRNTRWRRHRETPAGDPSELDGVAADPANAWADAEVFGRLFATLPARQRAALILRFYEDLDFAAIGRQLGCAEPSARSLVHRALADLRTRMPGRDDD